MQRTSPRSIVWSMRNRRRTIESLRRLAERPGTKAEGETARRLLEQMGGKPKQSFPIPPFNPSTFPPGTRIFYCYWCYANDAGTIRKPPPRWIQGQWWMYIKFDRLKQPQWVPVTSAKGCHIATEPFAGEFSRWMELTWCEDLEDHDARMEELIRRSCVGH